MNKFLENLKRQAEDNPLIAMGVAVASLTAVSKFINVVGESKSRRTWAKEVDRRARNSRR